MSNGLVIEKLTVRYGRMVALAQVDLDVPAGSTTAVLGRNGAGKSSLLRAVAGAVRPSAGVVTWQGEEVTKAAADQRARSGIVLVPEGRRIFPDLTVEENLRLGGFELKGEALTARTARMIELFPVLGARFDSPAGRLSGGQQQMLAIGRALMADPQLLLLDEPSLGLAPMAIDAVYEQLRALRKTDITILLVEQHIQRALSLVDHAVVLRLGEIVLREDPAALVADPRLVRAYLGAESA